MMKRFLFLMILSTTIVRGQELAHSFIFQQSKNFLSIPYIYLSNDSIDRPYVVDDISALDADWNAFHREEEFTKGNSRINLIVQKNQKVLYRLYQDSALVCVGELGIDSSRFELVPYDDENGDIQFDTNYYLLPIGLWRIEDSLNIYKKGYYKNGKKDGQWETTNLALGYLVTKQETYDEGTLIDSKYIGAVDSTSVHNFITQEWLGTGIGKFIFGIENVTFFLPKRLEARRKSQRNGELSYLKLDKNKKFSAQRSYNCGSGNYSGDYWQPKGKWKIEQIENDHYLVLGQYYYRILYITSDMLVIQYEE